MIYITLHNLNFSSSKDIDSKYIYSYISSPHISIKHRYLNNTWFNFPYFANVHLQKHVHLKYQLDTAFQRIEKLCNVMKSLVHSAILNEFCSIAFEY